MKKTLILFAILIPSMSFAQFSSTIQTYFDFGVDRYKNKFYGANFISDYAFSKGIKAGIGIGIGGADMLYYESNNLGDSRDAATLMSVFGDFQYKFIEKGISPYLNFDDTNSKILSMIGFGIVQVLNTE